jgi:MFS family permease
VFEAVLSHRISLAIFLFVALAFAPAGLAAIADHAQDSHPEDSANPGTSSGAMSAYALTLSLGFTIGPPVVGYIAKFDDAYSLGGRVVVVFYAALAAALLALVLAHFVKQRIAPKASS